MSGIKLCAECRWAKKSELVGLEWTYATCHSPRNQRLKPATINRVTGEIINARVEQRYKFCEVNRIGDRFFSWLDGSCGEPARQWEPKP